MQECNASLQIACLQLDKITPQEKAELDALLVEAVIDGGLPFSLTENPAIQRLFNRLRPAYKLPSRHDVSVEHQ